MSSPTTLHTKAKTPRLHKTEKTCPSLVNLEPELNICSPTEYYSTEMQEIIAQQCTEKNKQWIYEIIHNTFKPKSENVIIRKPGWVLCVDKHPGTDVRYLVVFNDTNIKTIRDLRSKDVEMLCEVRAETMRYLNTAYDADTVAQYKLYFHYVPSVFQLHLHISQKQIHVNNLRVKYLRDVIRNLNTDSLWYANALIHTNKSRMYKTFWNTMQLKKENTANKDGLGSKEKISLDM